MTCATLNVDMGSEYERLVDRGVEPQKGTMHRWQWPSVKRPDIQQGRQLSVSDSAEAALFSEFSSVA